MLHKKVEFKNDSLNGDYKKYYWNGIEAYHLICKNNFPYASISALDTNGKKIDAGSLKNGTGTLNSYYESGQLRSSMNYENQIIRGKFMFIGESGRLREIGILNCDSVAVYKRTRSNTYIKDFNLYAAKNQNFSQGTDYLIRRKDSSYSEIKSIEENTFGCWGIEVKNFSEDSSLLKAFTEFGRVKQGAAESFYENGSIKSIRNFQIEENEGELISREDGTSKYYYENGALKSVIIFKKGIEVDSSKYFDENGILIRIKVNDKPGGVYNVFNNEIVNRIDSNGLKQGKWIYMSRFSSTGCSLNPDEISYYKDGQPTGVWLKYGYGGGTTLRQKLIWKDSELAEKQWFSNYTGNLIAKGDVLNQETNHGIWEFYDDKKGHLKSKGSFIYGQKEGVWYEYKKNGKVKKEDLYKNGKLVKLAQSDSNF